MRVAHAADRSETVVSQYPAVIFSNIIKHLFTDFSLNIAHTLVDGAVIIHVRIVSHHGTGHAVSKFMCDDIQALRIIVGKAGCEKGPAEVVAHKCGVIHLNMILITEIIEDHNGCVKPVPADPADFFVIIIGTAVVVE